MASFQAQVEGLTGVGTITSGTNPSLAELTDFLVDGVNDVTRRIIQVKPQEAVKFQRESAITDTNSDLDLNGATILSVVREANADGSSDGSSDGSFVGLSPQPDKIRNQSIIFLLSEMFCIVWHILCNRE